MNTDAKVDALVSVFSKENQKFLGVGKVMDDGRIGHNRLMQKEQISDIAEAAAAEA